MTGLLAPHFTRREPVQQAGKYIDGLMSDLPDKNCWSLAQHAGDAVGAQMLAETLDAGIEVPWTAADEVYGQDPGLRDLCEERGVGYVPGVPCSFRVPLSSGAKMRADPGRRHVCIPADAPLLREPGCTGHAAQCPQRLGGGLVFREIKERRRKTVALPPELVGLLRARAFSHCTHNTSPDPSPTSRARVRCRAPVRAQFRVSVKIAGVQHNRAATGPTSGDRR